MNWKRVAFLLYPFFIVLLLIALLSISNPSSHVAQAGVIRRIEISQDRPAVIHLAQGRTTAISFAVRPEKVVPGNPQALEINFLSRDLTIRPLGPRPGNLIIYTKSSRYVILLQMTSEAAYDDAVNLTVGSTRGKALKLSDDAFQIVDLRVAADAIQKERTVTGQLSHSGHLFQTQDLTLPLKCKGCLIKRKDDVIEISCTKEIANLECSTPGNPVKLERVRR